MQKAIIDFFTKETTVDRAINSFFYQLGTSRWHIIYFLIVIASVCALWCALSMYRTLRKFGYIPMGRPLCLGDFPTFIGLCVISPAPWNFLLAFVFLVIMEDSGAPMNLTTLAGILFAVSVILSYGVVFLDTIAAKKSKYYPYCR